MIKDEEDKNEQNYDKIRQMNQTMCRFRNNIDNKKSKLRNIMD